MDFLSGDAEIYDNDIVDLSSILAKWLKLESSITTHISKTWNKVNIFKNDVTCNRFETLPIIGSIQLLRGILGVEQFYYSQRAYIRLMDRCIWTLYAHQLDIECALIWKALKKHKVQSSIISWAWLLCPF